MTTIKILKADIENNLYIEPQKCPIAQALKRLGFTDVSCCTTWATINGYQVHIPTQIDDKIMYMEYYNQGDRGNYYIPPADFEFEMDIPLEAFNTIK